MAITQAQVAQLYVALFNRAPEGAGLRAWVAAGASKTQAQLADDMLRSPAVQSYFNGSIDTNRGYVENIYKNILGKDYSQDPSGIDAWVRHLEAGHSRGETLAKLFEVAASAEARAADPTAARIFENKSAIAAYMAQKIGNIDSDGNGGYNYAPFQEIIRTTNATNLEEQKARVDALASAGVSKTLTEDVDNITGTAGDDTFTAKYYQGSGDRKSTLSPLDKVEAGAGKDTLNLTVLRNTNSTELTDTELTNALKGVKQIENLNIDSEVKFNASGVKFNYGLENLSISTIDKVKITETNTSNKVKIDTTGDVELTAAQAKETQIMSQGNVVLNAAEATKVDVSANGTANVNVAKAQTLKLQAGGATTVTTGEAIKKVNIDLKRDSNALTYANTNAAELTLANLALASDIVAAKAKKIDVTDVNFGSNSIKTDEQDVDLTMSYAQDSAHATAKLSSSAADKVKTLNLHAKAGKEGSLDVGNITSLTKVKVDGGMRNLTMDLSAQTALTNFDSSAFEGGFSSLKLKNVANSTATLGGGDDTVEVDSVANVQSINGGAGNDTIAVTSAVAKATVNKLTLTNFENLKITNALDGAVDMTKWANLNSVVLGGGASAGAQIKNLANGSTVAVDTVAVTADVAVLIKDAQSGESDVLNLAFNPKVTTAGLNNTGNFVLDYIETVNITSNQDTAKTATAINVINLKASAADKAKLTTINVKGDGNTELKINDHLKLKTVDASALKGKFTFDSTGKMDAAGTIKGGLADDKITFDALSGTSVTGGAGNDTFNVNKLGTGAGTFGADRLSSVTDFSRGDKLHLGNTVANKNSIHKYEADGSLDFANNLARALAAAKDHESKTAYFTYQSNTYLVSSDANDGVTADDYVTKLSGVQDLSAAKTDADGNVIL